MPDISFFGGPRHERPISPRRVSATRPLPAKPTDAVKVTELDLEVTLETTTGFTTTDSYHRRPKSYSGWRDYLRNFYRYSGYGRPFGYGRPYEHRGPHRDHARPYEYRTRPYEDRTRPHEGRTRPYEYTGSHDYSYKPKPTPHWSSYIPDIPDYRY